MAKWLARSQRGLLGRSLQVTQVPTEGQSTYEPVWSKVDFTTLLDMVEHLNDKTETTRVLLAEIDKLKGENEVLQRLAFSQSKKEFARGGPTSRPKLVTRGAGEDSVNVVRNSAYDGLIRQEPAMMVVINAPDASNGEFAEHVRGMAAVARPEYLGEIPISRGSAECTTRIDSSTFSRDSCDTPTSTDSSPPTPSE